MKKNPCYYCKSLDHEDTPCPERVSDAERFSVSGRSKYPTSRPQTEDEQAPKPMGISGCIGLTVIVALSAAAVIFILKTFFDAIP